MKTSCSVKIIPKILDEISYHIWEEAFQNCVKKDENLKYCLCEKLTSFEEEAVRWFTLKLQTYFLARCALFLSICPSVCELSREGWRKWDFQSWNEDVSEYSAACECLTLWVMIAWRKRREEEVHVSLISQQGKADNKRFRECSSGTVEIIPHIINL